jgi:nitrate/nitrite transporter NarK
MNQQHIARIAGLLYLLNIAIGLTALYWAQHGRADAAATMNAVGGAEYAVVVLLLGRLFEPAGRGLSWGVAAVGLIGCALSVPVMLHLIPAVVNPLVVFGLYCIGLGVLVLRSGLVPRILGALLVLGGLSWLTFADAALAQRLAPWNTAAGAIPEILLTLWLLLFGVRNHASSEGTFPHGDPLTP